MRNRKIASLLIAACVSAGLSRLGPAAPAQVTVLHYETAEQRIGRLMREAAGLQPIHHSTLPEERQSDDSAREQFRNWFDLNRTYSEALDKIDLSQISTPASLADPAMGQAAVKQAHARYDLDVAQEKRVKEVIDKLRQALTSFAWNSFYKQQISKSFEQGLAATIPQRQRVLEAEKQWLTIVDIEYTYARAHQGEFRVVQAGKDKGALAIPDSEIGSTLRIHVTLEQRTNEALVEAQEQFDQFQANMLKKMGMSAKDAGIE